MRRSRSGYTSYRGRRTLNDILRVIAIVLAVLVVLVLGGLFLGQKYLVFTDGGVRLDVPFLQREEPDEPDLGDINVVVQPAEPQDGPEEPQLPENSGPVMAALELPLSAVLDGTAAARLEEAGANALILDMKNEEGQLGWLSQQSLAAQAGVNSQTADINEALRQWNQGEVYTVARVCCFRDNTVPYQRNDVALRASYGNWRDELGLRWLNPDSADARAYVAALCGELAELGFDEILLDCCAFPTQGNLDAIVQSGAYGSGQYAPVAEEFLNQVRTAIEPWETVLSVRVERAVLTGEDTRSGLTAAALETYAQRLWMADGGETPALTDLLADAGITKPEERLVEIVPALDGEEQGASAVFSGT